MKAFLPVLLVSLAALSARGETMSREEFEALSPELASGEVAASEFDRERPGGFHYINPRSTDTSCGIPLSMKEKLDQQALKSEADRMRAQGLKPTELKIFGRVISGYNRGLLRTLLTRPGLDLHISDIFDSKDRAEALETKNFPRSKFNGNNDESDVFRHFTFATLLTLKMNSDLAKQTLDAHEWYSRSVDTVMDRFNNREALRFAAAAREKWKNLDEKTLEPQLLAVVKAKIADRTLVVLQPKLKTTPKPPAEFYRFAHDLLKKPLD